MGRNVRIGLVVLGAAMTVYATASLTGGWLGTPPWNRPRPMELVDDDELAGTHFSSFNVGPPGPGGDEMAGAPDRSRGTALLLAGGIACATFGLWPRRRPEAT